MSTDTRAGSEAFDPWHATSSVIPSALHYGGNFSRDRQRGTIDGKKQDGNSLVFRLRRERSLADAIGS
jgi:hypothetical protein